MNVKELIEKLQEFDGDTEIMGYDLNKKSLLGGVEKTGSATLKNVDGKNHKYFLICVS